MGILLGVLALVVAMLIHHFAMAKPATDLAYEEIQKLFDKRNAQGVVTGKESEGIDAKLVQPKDVQETLKKKPWSTVTNPDYVVETYWWYGMPHQNYITVLYYKNGESLRFNTHYKNQKPPAEDLPGAIVNDTGAANNAPPTTGAPSTGQPMPPPGDAPATDKPADDKPATEKPVDDKPAEAKPAEEKPAEATEKKE